MNRTSFPLLALLGALSVGCSEEIVAVSVTALTEPPLGLEAASDGIEMFDGTGVGLEILAYTEDPGPVGANQQTCDGECESQVDPIDPAAVDITFSGDAIDVYRVDDGVYIVAGVEPGEGVLYVTSSEADGTFEIPVTVVPQE